jgi:hypothetical protein
VSEVERVFTANVELEDELLPAASCALTVKE